MATKKIVEDVVAAFADQKIKTDVVPAVQNTLTPVIAPFLPQLTDVTTDATLKATAIAALAAGGRAADSASAIVTGGASSDAAAKLLAGGEEAARAAAAKIVAGGGGGVIKIDVGGRLPGFPVNINRATGVDQGLTAASAAHTGEVIVPDGDNSVALDLVSAPPTPNLESQALVTAPGQATSALKAVVEDDVSDGGIDWKRYLAILAVVVVVGAVGGGGYYWFRRGGGPPKPPKNGNKNGKKPPPKK